MTSPIVLLQRLPVKFDYKLLIKEEILLSDATDDCDKQSNHLEHKNSVYKKIKKKSTRYRKKSNSETVLNIKRKLQHKNGSSILSNISEKTKNTVEIHQSINKEEISTDGFLPIVNRCLNVNSSPMVVLERLPIKMERFLVNQEILSSDETIADNTINQLEASDTQQVNQTLDLNNYPEIDNIATIKLEVTENSNNTIQFPDNQLQEDELNSSNKLNICDATSPRDISDNEISNVLNNTLTIKEENELVKSDEENSFSYNSISLNYSSNDTENRNSDDFSTSNAVVTNTPTEANTLQEIIDNVNNSARKNNCNIVDNRCKSISLLEACEQIAAYDNRDLFVFEQNLIDNDLFRNPNESDNELPDEIKNVLALERNKSSRLSEIDSSIETNREVSKISNEYFSRCNVTGNNLFAVAKKNLFCELCMNCNIVLSRRDKVVRKCYICQTAVHFQCLICKSLYKYISGIRKHVLSKHLETDETYNCSRCNHQFATRFRLQDHLRFCKVDPFLKCEFCPMKTSRRSSLKSHLITRHNNYSPNELEIILKNIVEKARNLKEKTQLLENNTLGSISYGQSQFTLSKFIKLYCGRCNKLFTKIVGKRQRECSICNTKLKLQCYKCERRYSYRNSMTMHLKTSCARMFNVVLLKCNNCSYLTCNKANLTRHILRKHTDIELKDFVQCNICSKQFRILENMRSHQLLCGKQPYLNCNYCTYTTLYKSGIKHHMCKTKRKMFRQNNECKINDATFSSNSIDSIILRCHNCNYEENVTKKITRCKVCNTLFQFRCSLCNDVKMNFQQLRLHLTYEHSENTFYDCMNACGKSFNDELTYRKHILTCINESLVQLSNAEKPAVSKKPVSKPVQPDKNVSMFCKECGKCYQSKGRLEFHISRCELSKPPLSCDHCSFRTAQKNNLINHIQSKHASRLFRHIDAFQCDICSVMFKNYFVYIRHVEDCRPREKKN